MIVERQTAENGEKCFQCGKEMTVKYLVDDIFICGECLYEAVLGLKTSMEKKEGGKNECGY